MRKLVFGIIAVVCVQFAFVNYMELQSPLDLALAPVYTGPSTVNGDLSWIEELDRYAMTPSEPEAPVSDKEHEALIVSRDVKDTRIDRPSRFRSAQRRSAPSVVRPASSLPAASDNPISGGFENVVISYNRPSETPNCGGYEAPRNKRRSYIAKAFPAVKKPWEWMKAIGSKLY